MGLNRREVLKGLGAATASGALAGCKPEEPLEPGTIEHVVLVMMENRTFDHMLGSLSLVEGRDDINGLQDGMSNPHPDGGDVPIRRMLPEENCLPDPPHSWSSSHAQYADGEMSGFVSTYLNRFPNVDPSLCMAWLGREDLPASYAMSDAYATCAAWFSSLMTSTWPNRLYAVAADSAGMTGNDYPPGESLNFPIETIFERLDASGITWGAYPAVASMLTLFFRNLRQRDEIYTLEDFFDACEDGTLPSVSWVEPAYGLADDHPPAHSLLGQVFMASVHNAVANSPQWDKTLIVFYYDEHGGFFDHEPPPTVADDRASQGFDQLGARVPAIVCGPWVRPGHVSDVQFEHCSALAEIERLFGVDPLTTRDANANDLSSLLDEERMATGEPYPPAELPVIEMTSDEIRAQCDAARSRNTLGQPEAEAALDALQLGHPHDRRDDYDGVMERFLARAQQLGALRIVD
ncbi:MAG: twin-arginine translocation signal domain-containing protein [Deltaproteobacteria bacterium]|nr:MAG: twin-arginine translocation signal domain-containing protein [Deltaproteobacteria bacterium]